METFDLEEPAARVRCDKSIETYEWDGSRIKEFNFERFTLYLQLQNEVERRQRLRFMTRGKKVPSVVEFTDEILINELCNMYGLLDTESDHFMRIFNTYKEERLEEIAEWMQNEQDIDQILSEDTDSASTKENFSVFTKEEIEMFQNVSQGAVSGCERFVLPRCETKPMSASDDFNRSLNLAEFDPHIQLPPKCIPASQCPAAFSTTAEALAATLPPLTHKYPFGITPAEFISAYKSVKSSKPDVSLIGSSNFQRLLLDQVHVIWPQLTGIESEALIYPTYLQGLISTPMGILWKIMHQLKVVLALSSGIIKVKDAISLYEEIFGFKLDNVRMKNWGFESDEAFIRFLFNYWSHSRIKCVQSSQLQGMAKNPPIKRDALYLIHATGSSIKQIKLCKSQGHANAEITNQLRAASISQNSQNQSQVPNESKSESRILNQSPQLCVEIPSTCIRDVQELRYEMFDVKKGRETKCKLASYFNPCFFYVNLKSQVTVLEKFQELLRKEYSLERNQRLRVRNSETLRKGMPLVIWDDINQEFCRATFEEKVEANLYKVRSIDFGFVLKVALKNIWFLLGPLADKLSGQAIPCQLFNVNEPKEWGKCVQDYCYDLLNDANELTVSFKERFLNAQGRKVYLVRVARKGNPCDVGEAVEAFIRDQQQAFGQIPKCQRPPPSSVVQATNGRQYALAGQSFPPRTTTIRPAGPAQSVRAHHPSHFPGTSTKLATTGLPNSNPNTRSSNSWAQITRGKSRTPGSQRENNDSDFPPL